MNEKLEALNKLQKLYESYREQEQRINKVIPYFFESPLVNSFDSLLDYLIDQFAKCWEIDINTLCWHIYENCWGENERECVVDGETIIVCDNETFLETI